MILLVMYELKVPDTLAPLEQAIEFFGPSYRFFDSFFLVCTYKSPLDLQRAVSFRVDGQADIFVSRLAREHAEHLPREAHDWLAARQESYSNDCDM